MSNEPFVPTKEGDVIVHRGTPFLKMVIVKIKSDKKIECSYYNTKTGDFIFVIKGVNF